MDIARPDLRRKKRKRRVLLSGAGLLVLALVTIGLTRLGPALPLVESPPFTDTVKRGTMPREVRGTGTLVPEEIRWITATSPGRVENIRLLPGVMVQPDTVLVELSNPELEQATFEAESQWHAAERQLEKLKLQLQSDRLTQKSAMATLKADLVQAKIEAQADEILRKDGLVPVLVANKSRAHADELETRYALEEERLALGDLSAPAQLKVQEAEVERLKKLYHLKKAQMDDLKVKAGIAGVLQHLGDDHSLQPGQQLIAGANIARIANPAKLKAEVKVAETQAKDLQFDQRATIDTRNGIVEGHVIRIDPVVQNGTVTVDLALNAPPPQGSRPDLSVDATIILERLEGVLHIGRPVTGQVGDTTSLFKLVDGGKRARRVPVKLGRASVSSVEIVQGLSEGDQIILSDMSQYDGHDQVRLR